MASKTDPLIRAFRGEIMDKIVKHKLIDLAYRNKGSFLNTSDFCDQFREQYGADISNRVITGWMKELGIELQSSVTFINNASLEPKASSMAGHLKRTGGDPHLYGLSEEELDQVFDNE